MDRDFVITRVLKSNVSFRRLVSLKDVPLKVWRGEIDRRKALHEVSKLLQRNIDLERVNQSYSMPEPFSNLHSPSSRCRNCGRQVNLS
jgi:hypothetical protein